MKIIVEAVRNVMRMGYYRGVCDGCGAPLEYDDELIVIQVADLEDRIIFCPADRLVCPECNKEIITLKFYKNLEVTGELAAKKEGKE